MTLEELSNTVERAAAPETERQSLKSSIQRLIAIGQLHPGDEDLALRLLLGEKRLGHPD